MWHLNIEFGSTVKSVQDQMWIYRNKYKILFFFLHAKENYQDNIYIH